MQRAAESADARIVDQDVDTSKGAFDLPGRCLNRNETGHIAGNHFGPASCLSDRLRRRFESGKSASTQNGDGAKARQFQGDGGANAPARAGNDCHLSGQGNRILSNRIVEPYSVDRYSLAMTSSSL